MQLMTSIPGLPSFPRLQTPLAFSTSHYHHHHRRRRRRCGRHHHRRCHRSPHRSQLQMLEPTVEGVRSCARRNFHESIGSEQSRADQSRADQSRADQSRARNVRSLSTRHLQNLTTVEEVRTPVERLARAEQSRAEPGSSTKAGTHPLLRSSPRTKGVDARVRRYAPPRAHGRERSPRNPPALK